MLSYITALSIYKSCILFFFFQAEDGIRDVAVTGVQTCALPISLGHHARVARPAALQEQLPELQQVPSPQGDSRATVYSAAIERLPRDRVHAQCSEQMVGGVAR